MNKQKGFTLIELVVVMVILGIMAAYAVPKFFDFRSQANIAVINGMAGAVNSVNVTAHGAALAANKTAAAGPTQNISMEGTTVDLNFGYPAATAAGIGAAVSFPSASFVGAGTGPYTFTLKDSSGTSITNCLVTYTGAASASSPPTIATTTSGC